MRKIVNLASGGLDSTLISVMTVQEGHQLFPLFIDYGQISLEQEYNACLDTYQKLHLPEPVRMDLSGFGKIIKSGLTSNDLHIVNQAFTPNRNFLFILMGSSYAYQVGADSVAVGFLREDLSLFPDQTSEFLEKAQIAISCSLGVKIDILTPLMDFTKQEVIVLAEKNKISGTYSCHAGTIPGCGECIACKEFN